MKELNDQTANHFKEQHRG